MPINYYSDQLVVKLDLEGYIKQVILNSYDDITVQIGESVIHLFSENSTGRFLDEFSKAIQNTVSYGLRVELTNNKTAFMFLLRQDEDIILFFITLQDVISLLDELVGINNEQVRSMRNLHKTIAQAREDTKHLEEIMKVNNELINLQRQLSQSNQELSELNQKLEAVTLTDYLTNLPNRRKFFLDVYQNVQQQDYLLTMMDFNNFKIINDQYGHKQGDNLLIAFAQKITELIKSDNGVAYRLGGDEFAILSPVEHGLDPAKVIEELDPFIQEFDSRISMAYGSVPINKHNVNESNKVEESMHQADRQMYKLKIEFHATKNPS